jgi:hypothetical protein
MIIITCYLHFCILLYILCIRYISSYLGVIIKNVIAGRALVQSLAVAYNQGRTVSILDPRWQ